MTSKAKTDGDPLSLVSTLSETGTIDPVYRDVYLERARALLAGIFPVEEFRHIEQQKAHLATLPVMIGRALEKADWPRVKESATAARRSAGRWRASAGRSRRPARSTPSATSGSKRRAALKALTLTRAAQSDTVAASMDPQEAARLALKSGDMKGLAKLAETVMAAMTPATGGRAPHEPAARSAPDQPSADLLTPYSEDPEGVVTAGDGTSVTCGRTTP